MRYLPLKEEEFSSMWIRYPAETRLRIVNRRVSIRGF